MISPIAEQIRTRTVNRADREPVLAIAYSRSNEPGEVITAQTAYATIEVGAATGDGSKVRITIKHYKGDQHGSVSLDTTTNVDGNVEETLGGVINKLNTLRGITAWALDAPHSLDTQTDTWTAVTETRIPPPAEPLKTLQRTLAGGTPFYMRVGEPTVRDRGYLRLTRLQGSATGHANGTVKIIRDALGETAETLREYTLVAALTNYEAYTRENAPTLRGPLLVEVNSDDISVGMIRIETMQGNLP